MGEARAPAVERARFAATAAVFGAVWGALEMTLGAALHAARLPLSGLVMTAVGLGIALTARRVLDRRGIVLAVGLVAAVLKLFSFAATSPLSPAVAIVVETLLAEAVLAALGAGRIRFALAGGVAGVYPLVHRVAGQALLFGADVFDRYLQLLAWGGELFGLDAADAWRILGALVALYLLAGVSSGLAAWSLAGAALRRLGRARG